MVVFCFGDLGTALVVKIGQEIVKFAKRWQRYE